MRLEVQEHWTGLTLRDSNVCVAISVSNREPGGKATVGYVDAAGVRAEPEFQPEPEQPPAQLYILGPGKTRVEAANLV
jgi:hypothetical protein